MKSTTMIYFLLASVAVKSAVVQVRDPITLEEIYQEMGLEAPDSAKLSERSAILERGNPLGFIKNDDPNAKVAIVLPGDLKSSRVDSRDVTDLEVRAGTVFTPSMGLIKNDDPNANVPVVLPGDLKSSRVDSRDVTDLEVRAGTVFTPSDSCVNCMVGCLATKGISWAWRSITSPRLKASSDIGIWAQCVRKCIDEGKCFNHYLGSNGVMVTAETGQMYNYMQENGYIQD